MGHQKFKAKMLLKKINQESSRQTVFQIGTKGEIIWKDKVRILR